jgi:ferrous iron transport protein B
MFYQNNIAPKPKTSVVNNIPADKINKPVEISTTTIVSTENSTTTATTTLEKLQSDSTAFQQAKLNAVKSNENAMIERLNEDIKTANLEIENATKRINELRSGLIENSFLGVAGRFIEPAVKPLGWDWKVGVAVIASFPAREVIISTLGTIYSLGAAENHESEGLQAQMKSAQWPDGRPVFTLATAMSIMIFFALCAQCSATLMTIRRETNSWRWPIFSFAYMTTLAYIGAWVAFQLFS